MSEASAVLAAELDPPDDQQASASMRRHLATVLLARCASALLGRNAPFTVLATDDHGRFQRQHAGRQLGSGVGMGKAAAEGAPVADRGMRDMGDRFRQ